MTNPNPKPNSTPRDIFLDLLERSPSDRHAALDQLQARDPSLAAEVRALLASHEKAAGEDFMSSPTATTAPATPITETPGARVGPYKLLQLIGEGGFGSVFLAEQTHPVRRRVALKIIKLGMDTRHVIARFEAERQALALMDHPHIARVLDAGATDSGRPFFVMEYVVGDAITLFADAHKLTVRDRLELFAQVCSAVQHAHTKGIIHRDIKPGNVLVSMVDGRPFAKVIDFGIAKATAGGLTDRTLFTEHRQLIGTLEYMSPEQAEGSPDIDTRTDVYALGVLLYELLTGATPLDAKRLRHAAWDEMRRIIKEEEPLAPSQKLSRDLPSLAAIAAARQSEPARLSTLLRGELDWIAIKALDKDRARRYETPSALAADVERHLQGQAIQAAPPSRAYRLRKFVRRNKGPVMAGSGITVALMLGMAGTAWGWSEAVQTRSVMQSERDKVVEIVQELAMESAQFKLEPGDDRVWVDIQVPPDGTLPAGTQFNLERVEGSTGSQYRMQISHQHDHGEAISTTQAVDAMAWYVRQVLDERENAYAELAKQSEAAERSAYTANLALAQSNIEAQNYSEARARLAECPEEKRGWEWRFLSACSMAVVSKVPVESYSTVFSKDGSMIAAKTDSSVECFTPTGKHICSIPSKN